MKNPALRRLESRYEITKRLGGGGMGEVFLARHRLLNVYRVVKTIRPDHQTNEESTQRFIREAQVAAELEHHQNVARLYEFEMGDEGTAIMIMEYIQGHDLTSITRGSPVPVSVAIEIADQALSALGYLHRNNFVHRDISPDNLMLTKDTQGKILVKLIDLGIAKSLEGKSSLTVPGSFIGKLPYAAPEHFTSRDEGAEPRSDLYSLGIVLYEMVTGQHPIEGSTPSAIVASQLHKPPKSFDETDPNGRVPEQVRRIILRSLRKGPEKRFQSANEFRDALRRARPGNHESVETTMETLISSLDLAKPRDPAISEGPTRTLSEAAASAEPRGGAAERLIELAREMLTQEDYDGALEYLEGARKLDAGLPAIDELEDEIAAARSERQRSDFEPVLEELLEREDWEGARDALAAVELISKDRVPLLNRIAIARSQAFGRLVAELGERLERGELAEARAEIDAAKQRHEDPDSRSELERLEDRLVEAERESERLRFEERCTQLLDEGRLEEARELLKEPQSEQLSQAKKQSLLDRLDRLSQEGLAERLRALEKDCAEKLRASQVTHAHKLLAGVEEDLASWLQEFSHEGAEGVLRRTLSQLHKRVQETEQKLNADQLEKQVEELLEDGQVREASQLIATALLRDSAPLKPEDRLRLERRVEQHLAAEFRRVRLEIDEHLDAGEVAPARALLSQAILDFGGAEARGQAVLRAIETRVANAERRLEVSRAVERAEVLAQSQSFHAAIDHLQRALELDPDNERARQLIARHGEALGRQERRATRAAALKEVVARVRTLIEDRDLEAAQSELLHAEEELGRAEELEALRLDLDQAQKVEQLKKAQRLVARAEELHQLGDDQGARALLLQALERSPGFDAAERALEAIDGELQRRQIEAKRAAAIQEIEAKAEGADFEAAMKRLDALRVEFGHDDELDLLAVRVERQKRFHGELKDARALILEREFDQAEERLSELYESHATNQELAEEISALLGDVRRRRSEAEQRRSALAARNRVGKYLEAGELADARSELDRALTDFWGLEDFSDLAEQLGKRELELELSDQVDRARDSVRRAIQEGRLTAARAELNRALKSYEGDQRLQVLEHELESAIAAERTERNARPSTLERIGPKRVAISAAAILAMTLLLALQPWRFFSTGEQPEAAVSPAVGPVDTAPPSATDGLANRLAGLEFGNYHALVIANDQYQNLEDLKSPRRDAEALAEVLTNRYDFEVETLFDATRREMYQGLLDYRERLGSDDNLLVYYAGHGHTDLATGRGFWQGVDAHADSNSNSLRNSEVIRQLEDMQAKQVLVIADSCFAGSLIDVDPTAVGIDNGVPIEDQVERKSRLVIASGKDLPILDSGGDGHSVFSRGLLQVLRDGNEPMDIRALFDAVRKKTVGTSLGLGLEQDPQIARLSADEGGGFFFVPNSQLEAP